MAPLRSVACGTEEALAQPPTKVAVTQPREVKDLRSIPMGNLLRNPSVRSGLFCPKPFTGNGDPREFIRQFNLWVEFEELDDEVAKPAFGLLLSEQAAVCFKTAKKADCTTVKQLTDLFFYNTILNKRKLGENWPHFGNKNN